MASTEQNKAVVRRFYDEDALVELTAAIAWENASSKFNRALRVPSQGLWRRAHLGPCASDPAAEGRP